MLKKVKGFIKRSAGKVSAAALAAGAVAVSATPSQAAVLDFTGIGTAITGEITPALASAMPIAGIILGVGVAWSMFRRFVR